MHKVDCHISWMTSTQGMVSNKRNPDPQELTVCSIPLVPLKTKNDDSTSIQTDTEKIKPELNVDGKEDRPEERKRWPPKALQPLWDYLLHKQEAISKHLPQGWKFGAIVAVISSSCALVANIIVGAICYHILRGQGVDSYIAPIRTGSCDDMNGLSTRIHLAINILSTLILGGSNYCMQVIGAPTRKDVDKAHQKREWLHIGVPNLKNLRFIPTRKLCLWLILGGSSIPLHLMWVFGVLPKAVALTRNS